MVEPGSARGGDKESASRAPTGHALYNSKAPALRALAVSMQRSLLELHGVGPTYLFLPRHHIPSIDPSH